MRTVLITGGTGDLGTAVTQRFVKEGHRVAVTRIDDRDDESIERDAREAGPNLFSLKCDVTDEQAVASTINRIEARFGPVEVLAHLVGGWAGNKQVHEHTVDMWNKTLTLNLLSAFVCCRAVLPGMLKENWGRIVLVSAKAARAERKGQVAYAVAKGGIAVLAETIADETSGTGVTANVVAPSVLDTEANRAAMPDADPANWVPASDVAETILFFASEAAGQLRGAWLPVFGSS